MLDPLSLAAVSTVLAGVWQGVSNEAGKSLWETAGGLVRRIAGREVAAPVDRGGVEALARVVHDGVHRDADLARAWSAFAQSVQGVQGIQSAPRAGGIRTRPELPPSVRFFTDRKEAMKSLDREASRVADGRPRIALLHGGQGMGTTGLAVHWGIRQAKRFPDGQVYVDLRGTSSTSTDAALGGSAALRAVMRQLGVPNEEVPPAAEARVDAFRRLVSELRLLIVLDHAQSAAQVRPLLTSAPGVFVLVTAASPLAGLDALPVRVGPLTKGDAVRLLTSLAGKPAVRSARAVVPSLLARCGGSPFALRAAVPQLSASANQLSGGSHGSSDLAGSDPVHAAAVDAYALLQPDAARVYRLMSLRPWSAFTPASAAWSAGIDDTKAETILGELAAVKLLELTGSDRYFYRPAVRRHAEETAAREDGVAGCAAAVARVVEGYLHLALRAANVALPESWRVPPLPEQLAAGSYANGAAALEDLAGELGNLLEAVRAAAEFGDEATAVCLAQCLWPLQLKAGHHEEVAPTLRVAVRIADVRFPGTRTAGALHAHLALSLTELQCHEDAVREARAAASAESAAGHVRGHASAVELLGLVRLRQWRFDEAYACFDEAGEIYDDVNPDGEEARDLPRARALLERHRGRALRGLGRREEAQEHLRRALGFFRESGDTYNAARTLTDLADVSVDVGDTDTARPLIEDASTSLTAEGAKYHLAYLRSLRQRCISPPVA